MIDRHNYIQIENHPIDFKADYSEKRTKSLKRFRLLCYTNPIGWVFGILYLIHRLFQKAILSLITKPLFGDSQTRKNRCTFSLNELTSTYKGKKLSLKTPDGRTLEAMHFKGASTKTVLLFTGSHHSYEYHACPMVAAYHAKGFNILCLNYGGFGKSQGSPNKEGIELDADTAYQYIKTNYSTHEIYAHGYSLGSYPATYLAKNNPLKKVVVDRGFSLFSSVGKDCATKIAGKISGYIFKGIVNYAIPLDNTKEIANTSSDLLYASGLSDNIMLPHHAETFKKYAPNTTFLVFSGDHTHDHNSVWFKEHSFFWNWMTV